TSSRSRAAHRALSRFRPLYTAACRKPPSNDSPRCWASVRGGSEEMGRSFALAFWRGKEGLMSPHAGRARRSAAFGRACPTALGLLKEPGIQLIRDLELHHLDLLNGFAAPLLRDRPGHRDPLDRLVVPVQRLLHHRLLAPGGADNLGDLEQQPGLVIKEALLFRGVRRFHPDAEYRTVTDPGL